LTAPFTNRKLQDANVSIDEAHIKELRKNPATVNEKLKVLTKKQLLEVATILGFPIATKASIKEVKKVLVDYFNSGKKWENISGTTKN